MKDKPVSHKNKNTFKFLTFSERLNQINIDVIHSKSRLSANPEDASTFFLEAIQKWSDLNYTDDFVQLTKEIGSEIRTFSQVLYRKDVIANILLKYLSKEGSLALEALFELTVALARDLQYEFYPYFPKVFSALCIHITTKDTDLLEKIFTCFAYLFKFLWKYMVKDIRNSYSIFSLLLSNENREHIRNFAAESFGFLIRKVQCKEDFFEFIFYKLGNEPENGDGLGQLLFEVVKGVKNQFHSCTEQVLRSLLKFLGPSLAETDKRQDLPFDLIENVLLQTLESMANHTTRQYCLVVQRILYETVSQLLGLAIEDNGKHMVHLEHVLKLCLFWFTYKDGVLLTSEAQIFQIFKDLSKAKVLSEEAMKIGIEIITSISISGCLQLPLEDFTLIITEIFLNPSVEIVFYFTRKMLEYGMFEKDVLPHVLIFCVKLLETSDVSSGSLVLEILCEIVSHLKPMVTCGDDIKTFKKLHIYSPIDRKKLKENASKSAQTSNVIENFLLTTIEGFRNDIDKKNIPSLWSTLLCIPHLRFLKVECVSGIIEELSLSLRNYLLSRDFFTIEEAEPFCFALCQTYFSWLCIVTDKKEKNCFTTSFFLQLIMKHPKSVFILRMSDLYLSNLDDKLVVLDVDESLFELIIPNLASPFHLIRLFTLRICCAFNFQLPASEGNSDTQSESVFSICLEAEKIPVDVQNYREKLRWIRKLEYPYVQKTIPTSLEEFQKVPIYYLFGMLYINFHLLWDPSIKLIESFAHGDSKAFWKVFCPVIHSATELCENIHKTEDPFNDQSENLSGIEHQFASKMASFGAHLESPDVFNHRLLICKAMKEFPDVLEPRNKTIVPLLFRFIENEMKKIDNTLASYEAVNKDADSNISVNDNDAVEFHSKAKFLKRSMSNTKLQSVKRKKLSTSSVNDNKSNDMETEHQDTGQTSSPLKVDTTNPDSSSDSEEDPVSDEDSDDKISEAKESVTRKVKPTMKFSGTRRRNITKMLGSYLSVFASFKNPKAMFKAEELLQLYNELLCYHDPEIQKLAFNCILTYHHSYLIPYRENFYKILDNKTFKTEIVLFSLDAQNEIIQQHHRMGALNILMRILYGKMLHKTGNNTTGKSQAHTRQSLVLRFLAGCHAEELKMFFDLVFSPFLAQLDGEVFNIVKCIRQNLDLSSVVPIRRQHSALNTLGLILQHLGSLVPESLSWLLKVILVVTATSTTLLEKRNDILPHCVTLLKSVRVLGMMRLIQFFKSFIHHDYSSGEIDAVFEAAVWPMLPHLESDSVNQPSPLLRLLATWSDHPRYFILFAKHHQDSKSTSCIPHLMALYSNPLTKPRVIGVISKIIIQLLTLKTSDLTEEKANFSQIPMNLCLEFKSSDNENYGTLLLLPYVDKILMRLNMNILKAAKKKTPKSLSLRDLTILLKISDYIDDTLLNSQLIELLISFLHKKKVPIDTEVLILSTISNLIKKVKNPETCIRLLAPLFGKLTNQNSRTSLTSVFETLAEIQRIDVAKASVIVKINTWNLNLLSEPDYEKRLSGQREALSIIASMGGNKVDDEFCRIIVFNSCFMIKMNDDLALRDSASHLLQELVKIFSSFKTTASCSFSLLIFDTLLQEIQKGLKHESEAVRHEFISILAAVLHNNSNHNGLSELVKLCHEEQDLDFWENIRHLQVHRRARALLRFSNCLIEERDNGEKAPCHYLISYMVPIVSSFLFDTAYRKHVHVIDAAIETMGTVASVLPWQHYEPMLKLYLNMLSRNAEHHKTIVKIIVSILNAFHFDLKCIDKEASSGELNHDDVKDTNNIEEKTISDVQDDSMIAEKKLTDLASSTKIYNTITRSILPLLHRSLMKKTKSDGEHKLAGHTFPEDEEVLRVPIALAMVKLLQKLPVKSLEKTLPGLFLKMCELSKSRAESIRETTRETLVKMMQSLGPTYFPLLLREMTGVMKKGFQVHIMIFTINAVLTNLADQFKSGDLDPCVKSLTEACTNELFTDMAEEKEVTKITGKLKEARSTKSFSIYQILSKFVSENCLLSLVFPLKEVLASKHSHKSVKKVQECLRNIALGLSENAGISIKGRLIFIHAICNENIPGLSLKKAPERPKSEKYVRPDIFLVPKEPGRSGPPAKINVRTNAHILVEFGLQFFNFCLKKDNFGKLEEYRPMLDPFIPLLTECLSSNHVKIISTALRCLMWLYKFPLPSLNTQSTNIVNALFILLNKYAAVGMGQGDNFEMVVTCFKMLTIIVRDTNYAKLSDEQLRSLLSYIEQDIYDYTRQSTAFTLLKAVLSKKLEAPELPDMMSKIADMSITADQDFIRSQCRQVCMQYMLEYPLGKQLQKTVSYFLSQLEYFHEQGRISAFETINSMLTSFPIPILMKLSGLFLVPLSARLVNDESVKCRKMASQCIKNLLNKVNHSVRNNLFSIVLAWLSTKKLSHQRLGAQLCGIFAEIEAEQFESRLQVIFPIITQHITALKVEEVKSQTDERCTDHFLFHLLNAFAKVLTFCPVVKKSELQEQFHQLWEDLQSLILHPHSWVRLVVSQLFGILFSSYSIPEVLAAVRHKKKSLVFLSNRQKLRDLSADFSTQLQSTYLNDPLGEQIIRNLVYLAKVISELSEASDKDESVEVTLSWIIRKLCREAKKEVALTPANSQKRKFVFMFLGAISHELEKEKLLLILDDMLVPLCRELNDASSNADESLKRSAQEVLDLLKKVIGIEEFSSFYASIQSALFKKKVKRKHDRAVEAVTDPQRYANKRIKKQLNKKESKKRKLLKQKGKRKVKKTKFSDFAISS